MCFRIMTISLLSPVNLPRRMDPFGIIICEHIFPSLDFYLGGSYVSFYGRSRFGIISCEHIFPSLDFYLGGSYVSFYGRSRFGRRVSA
jgi:hypothetical protein